MNPTTINQPVRLTAQELAHQLESGAIGVIDVREPMEFAGGHIAGSLTIPLPELQGRLGELPDDQPLVVVCHAGSRSALATQQLLKAGRERVANLRGGLARWADEGYPLSGTD